MEPSSPSEIFPFRWNPDLRSGFLLFVVSALAAMVAIFIVDPTQARPRSPYLTPPQIQNLTFGTKEQTADLLWLRAIQDFDYCEKEIGRQSCASSGWLFHMLDLITDLAPSFRMPYAAGGLALSVVVNDYAGASVIFDKASKALPQDWPILSRAAYHALYEEKNKEKAASLMRQAAVAGAPPWYNLLATRLYLEEGRADLAKALLAEVSAAPDPDPLLIKTLQERIQKLDLDDN